MKKSLLPSGTASLPYLVRNVGSFMPSCFLGFRHALVWLRVPEAPASFLPERPARTMLKRRWAWPRAKGGVAGYVAFPIVPVPAGWRGCVR